MPAQRLKLADGSLPEVGAILISLGGEKWRYEGVRHGRVVVTKLEATPSNSPVWREVPPTVFRGRIVEAG